MTKHAMLRVASDCNERFTLDSNVLVYAADAGEPERQAAAIGIIPRPARRDCVQTPQALAEFVHATTPKRIVPRAAAARQVEAWMVVFPVTTGAGAAALHAALAAAASGRLQFFDALLLATARDAGCRTVISEDMAEGARLDDIRVVPASAHRRAVSPATLLLL